MPNWKWLGVENECWSNEFVGARSGGYVFTNIGILHNHGTDYMLPKLLSDKKIISTKNLL